MSRDVTTGTTKFKRTGNDSWWEVLGLQNRQFLQDQLDVYNILQLHEFDNLNKNLTRSLSSTDLGDDLLNGLIQLGWYLDDKPTFWNLAKTEITWQLSEGVKSSLLDTDVFTNPVAEKVEDQMLGRHPRYEGTILVRDYFHCFHRENGTSKIRHYYLVPQKY